MQPHLIICAIVFLATFVIVYIAGKYFNYTFQEDFVIVSSLTKEENDGLVVVSSHYNEDIEWLQTNTTLPVVVCSKKQPSPLCELSKNYGREATSYLKFIIDNYDNLPMHTAFIHGHQHAWHQKMTTSEGGDDLLYLAKNCAKYKEFGFISLNNCQVELSDEHKEIFKTIKEKGIWDAIFRKYLNIDMPGFILNDCCAQFIVSKDRILRHPVDAYKHWFDYIMNKDPHDDGGWVLGLLFEHVWHIIFGEVEIINKEEQRKMFNESCHVNV